MYEKSTEKFYEVRKTFDSTKIVHYNTIKISRCTNIVQIKGGEMHETYKVFAR